VIQIPHVVLNGDINILDIFKQLKSLFVKTEKGLIKTTVTYISNQENTILVETLIIEEEKKVQFFPMISQRDDGVVVRIYPGTDIEKTKYVKQSLAEIAKQILALFPEIKVGKTNLEEFLV
jgi:hypothetical protein